MKKLLAAALGDSRSDIVIRGGLVANVFSLELEEADVAIKEGFIVGVGKGYKGTEEYDASGCVVIPGLIDGHLHIESTMLAPGEFARAVVPRGTTTVFPDPHEIANTCGVSGIEFMVHEAFTTPLDCYFGAPSCVPPSIYETPRERIDDLMMMQLFHRELCNHLGEMMNYPGILAGDDESWAKVVSSHHLVRTGHMPGLCGKDLCAYMLTGCDSDHECTTYEEGMDKLRRGAWVMMRDSTTSRDIDDLIRIVLEDESRFVRCFAVSDDLSAEYILSNGHMDHKLRKMISLGVRPVVALAMLTINPARYFRLHDRGAIAPGMAADVAVVSSLEECRVKYVWKRGTLVARDGDPLFETHAPLTVTLPRPNTERIRVTADQLRIEAPSGKRMRVIHVSDTNIRTEEMIVAPRVADGCAVSDVERDILKAVVVEKNKSTGNIGYGFVHGTGIKKGAIGTSVAHDAHNFLSIGADDESMATALAFLAENQGGLVVAVGSEVIASLPLPIGGLMSDLSASELDLKLNDIGKAAAEIGIPFKYPFMAVSFLSLSVIPKLRLTDKGCIDLSAGGIVPLFVG